MPVNPKEAPPGHQAIQYDPQNGAGCASCAFVYRVQCHDMNCTSTGREDGTAVIFVSTGHPPDGDE